MPPTSIKMVYIALYLLFASVAAFRVPLQPVHLAAPSPHKTLTLPPIKKISGTVHLPGSKSISNRLLLLSALSQGTTTLHNVLHSEDTDVMLSALAILGVSVIRRGNDVVISGKGGPFIVSKNITLHLGNAGTAMRPLAALLCACSGGGSVQLVGSARMHERPIAELVDAVKQLGADITCSVSGCPPVFIRPKRLTGGNIFTTATTSSQFISSLLLLAPLCATPTSITVMGGVISEPYITMTIMLMKQFGINVLTTRSSTTTTYTIQPGPYVTPSVVEVEGDASSSSYFLAAAALCNVYCDCESDVTVVGCGTNSIQGDVEFASALQLMGANVSLANTTITIMPMKNGELRPIDFDCAAIPDAAMTLAIVAGATPGITRLRNVGSWRMKECNRLEALITELAKVGVMALADNDDLIIYGRRLPPQKARFCTYNDHRMAMCTSLLACCGVEVTIENPECVNKTFPEYFQVLRNVASF